MQEILSKLFGGGRKTSEASLMQGLTGALSGGGLNSLLDKFNAAGLSKQAQSWVGGGPNEEISGDQVRHALGNEEIERLSQKSGLSPEETANDLAQLIPATVNEVTPDGVVPDEAGLQENIKALAGKIPGI